MENTKLYNKILEASFKEGNSFERAEEIARAATQPKSPGAKKIASVLFDGGCMSDQVSKRGEVFTARRGFFYTNGKTANDFAVEVQRALGTAFIITGKGEVTRAFRGGASLRASSHWWVTFRQNLPIKLGAQK